MPVITFYFVLLPILHGRLRLLNSLLTDASFRPSLEISRYGRVARASSPSHTALGFLTISSLRISFFRSYLSFLPYVSNMASTKSDNIILKGPDDWPKWEREFQKKAIATDLWDYIKGGNDRKALRIEPDMPEPDSFRAPPPPPAGSTRASASATPPASAGLNADEGRNYQFAWNIYVQRKKDYDTQRANVKSLKDWVTETIAQQYNTSSYPPTEGLHDWYK